MLEGSELEALGPTQKLRAFFSASTDSVQLSQQLCDYAGVSANLFWQRQMIFGAALALAAYYYDVWFTLITLSLITLSESYDHFVSKGILSLTSPSLKTLRNYLRLILLGTMMSAGVIIFYAIWISWKQGPTTHFMPLFFLFAAALFAAMNNHQLLPVLAIRLIMYGATFLSIPMWDIWITGASIKSDLWTQMFTSIFVMYFIIDCSRIHLMLYRQNLRQMFELRAEHERTKLAYRAKSEFLSTMSHELRTPMTSINGSVSLALSGHLGELPDRSRAILAVAQRNCARLATLIDDILDLQKIESGKMKFVFEPVELSAFLTRVVAQNQPYADKFSVSISTAFPNESVYVNADKSRLEQVMANLLSNAAKFSFTGGHVTVLLDIRDKMARISVIDAGVGLSEDHRDKVFDQFSQLDSSDERKAGGTGLGMNISKRIIEAHGGTIDYSKNLVAGTTFTVDLKRVSEAGQVFTPSEDEYGQSPQRYSMSAE